jgi:shikimate kinase
MNQSGITVFLNVGLDSMMRNIEKNNQSRPLIDGYSSHELKVKLTQMLQERLPFYEQSRITLSETELNPKALNAFVM